VDDLLIDIENDMMLLIERCVTRASRGVE